MSDSVTPWTAAHQVFLSFTIFWSFRRLMSIEAVMPSNHLIPCRPLLLLPSIFPSIRVFSNESALNGQSTGASASASVLPMNIQGRFPLGLTDLISLQSKGLSRVFSSTTVHQGYWEWNGNHLWGACKLSPLPPVCDTPQWNSKHPDKLLAVIPSLMAQTLSCTWTLFSSSSWETLSMWTVGLRYWISSWDTPSANFSLSTRTLSVLLFERQCSVMVRITGCLWILDLPLMSYGTKIRFHVLLSASFSLYLKWG